METKPLLKVTDLSVVLDDKKILDNISFEVKPQETLAIIGPNGSGKSVLLKTILGMLSPASGKIEWANSIQVAYLPQRFQVDYYLPMSVQEFLDLKPNHKFSVPEVFKMLKINEDWLKKNLATLSGGELQKVLLAWAILDKPQIIFFDEPTENIDIVSQESIYSLLHHLQETTKVAIVLVSHDLHVVYRYANQVLCLNQKMLCYGEPETALTQKTLSELYGDHTFFHHHHYRE